LRSALAGGEQAGCCERDRDWKRFSFSEKLWGSRLKLVFLKRDPAGTAASSRQFIRRKSNPVICRWPGVKIPCWGFKQQKCLFQSVAWRVMLPVTGVTGGGFRLLVRVALSANTTLRVEQIATGTQTSHLSSLPPSTAPAAEQAVFAGLGGAQGGTSRFLTEEKFGGADAGRSGVNMRLCPERQRRPFR
jgi:hypothetical protein